MNNRILKYFFPCAVFVILFVVTLGFNRRDDDVKFVVPVGWPKPAYDLSKNKLTTAGFTLGRKLFFDPGLSSNGATSCASCHIQSSGFTRADGSKNKRNPLTLFNLAWNTSFMWDGGINNLEVQPLAPIAGHSEMDNSLANIVKKLNTSKAYKARFYLAFGDSTVTGQHVLKAIAQFTVMFESFNTKYDKYIRHEPGGDMSTAELNGLKIFRANCASCHAEPLFTNYSFQNIGLAVDGKLNDMGRMIITNTARDSLKFKVPSLRNCAGSYPYMHDGRFKTLMQVLDHYTRSVVQGPTTAQELRTPMILTSEDKRDIIAFLQTLTDKEFLSDTRFGEPKD